MSEKFQQTQKAFTAFTKKSEDNDTQTTRREDSL